MIQMKLINGKKLAKRMGVPSIFVTAMKSRGFVFAYGGRTLYGEAMRWLRKHPEFRYSDYIEEHRKTPKKPPTRRQPQKRLQRLTGYKRNGRARTHG